MRKISITIALLAGLAVSVSCLADGTPTVTDLAWMTGDWSGGMGPQTLEEHWIAPAGKSIGALVRSTRDNATGMIEMIVIEEENDSLVLRVQQWNPGYKPRTPGPQTMKLVSLTANSVKFEDVSGGGLKTLGYSRPTPDTFNIDISTPAGASFTINLKAM